MKKDPYKAMISLDAKSALALNKLIVLNLGPWGNEF